MAPGAGGDDGRADQEAAFPALRIGKTHLERLRFTPSVVDFVRAGARDARHTAT